MLKAVVSIQHALKNYYDRKFFNYIKKCINSLYLCSRPALFGFLNLKQFISEPVDIVIKLQGYAFPPTVVYAIRLRNVVK